ncbi:MAG: class I SAM-dependent methyltransferase [Chloroflexota bacterium]
MRSTSSARAARTRSRWLAGADRVTGIDFSPRMLALARELAEAVGAPAAWVEADVLDLPHDLDGTADLVYYGRGSIMWIQDLDGWAAGLARLLRPGGRLVIFEGHPAGSSSTAMARRLAPDRVRLLRGPRGVIAAGRPPTSSGCRSLTTSKAWKFAQAWTLGES